MTTAHGTDHIQPTIEEDHSQAEKTVVPELIQKDKATPTLNSIPLTDLIQLVLPLSHITLTTLYMTYNYSKFTQQPSDST